METFFTNVTAGLLKAIAAIRTALLNGGEMALFQNDYTPVVGTVVGDLTEATFTGYSRATLTTYSIPYVTDALGVACNTPLAVFTPASPYTVGNTIYGFWVEDAAGDLAFAGRFQDPVSMNGAGQLLEVIAKYAWGNP